MWLLDQEFESTDLEKGFYIVRVRLKEDYHRILDGGPWMIQRLYVTVRKWRPYFLAKQKKDNFDNGPD